jgi:hypothetical protein
MQSVKKGDYLINDMKQNKLMFGGGYYIRNKRTGNLEIKYLI